MARHRIAGILPLRPFVESIQAPFNPTVEAPGFLWGNLAIVVAWGVVRRRLAARTFKWEPIADVDRSLAPSAASLGDRGGRSDVIVLLP